METSSNQQSANNLFRDKEAKILGQEEVLDLEQVNRIIEMAWEDRTTFDAIKLQFGLTQGQVEKLMRKNLSPNSFRRWRKRVSSGVSIKHALKRVDGIRRFKCSRQKSISGNRIAKR